MGSFIKKKQVLVLLLSAALLPAGSLAAAAEGWYVENGEWYYEDRYGEPVRADVSPDGWLLSVSGAWERTEFDHLVGAYELAGERLSGSSEFTEPRPEQDGSVHSAYISLTREKNISVRETWAYPNGHVLRTCSADYARYGDTFYQLYEKVRNYNQELEPDRQFSDNASRLTDNGDGTVTLTFEEQGGITGLLFRKKAD